MDIAWFAYQMARPKPVEENLMVRKDNPIPKNFDGRFDNLQTSPSASGGFFPTLRNDKPTEKGNKMATKAASFKVVVKDGHEDYQFDVKSGQYKSKTVDYVEEFTDLGAALAEFLVYVTDSYNEDKVSLTFVPAKNKK